MEKIIDKNLQSPVYSKNSLAKYSHINIGNKPKYLFVPKNIDELIALIGDAFKDGLEVIPIGAASNMLFGNIRNRVIIVDKKLPKTLETNGNEVWVSSNYKISDFIDKMKQSTLGGLEFLSGIPAHIGGAVSMNAGAFGKNISDYIVTLEVINKEGEKKKIYKKDIKFGYRKTSLEGFITKIGFILDPKPKEEIESEVNKIITLRKYKHPYDFPSLGSTFKNPKDIAAGKLIEECGLKGKIIGGAQISEKHANFIVNRNNATFKDVMALIGMIRTEVYQRKNTLLNLEIKVID